MISVSFSARIEILSFAASRGCISAFILVSMDLQIEHAIMSGDDTAVQTGR